MSSSDNPAWVNAIRLRGLEHEALELEDTDVARFPALQETFKQADDEHLRVSTEYPEDAYDLIATPSTTHTTLSEVVAILVLLGVNSVSSGRYESKIVRFQGRYYTVSIVVNLCG
jgi:hypothetical protein